MKFHPFAEIFPFIEGADFDSLVEDIKAHGLRERIWLCEGKILDGRNRFLACEKAGIVPEYREYTGTDALAFVWSINAARRHLDSSQRAMAASKYKDLASANLHSGDTAERASEALNVSRRSVFHADRVRHDGSKELQRAVENGELSVSRAASVVYLPKPEQLPAATAKAVKLDLADPDVADERWIPDEDEESKLELAEKEYAASIDKVMLADDKLTAAHDELKRQAAEIATLKISRDGFMNGKVAVTKMLKAEQRKTERLTRELATAQNNIEALRERTAIMQEAL